mgnify:CR=1 FL=1
MSSSVAEAQKYKKGYYFTNKGEKITGQIRHVFRAKVGNKPDNGIIFRQKKGAKKVDLSPYQISAFVIEADSFSTLNNFRVNSLAFYKKDFVQVAIVGNINMLIHYSTVSSTSNGMTFQDPVYTEFLQKDGKTIRMNTKKDFYEALPKLLVENPLLAADVKSKRYKLKDLQKIIEEYNSSF